MPGMRFSARIPNWTAPRSRRDTGRAMSQENVEVIQRMNAAFNAGNYDAFVSLLDPEVEIVDHLPLPDVAQTARGPGEVRAVLDAWKQGFTGFEGHVGEYVDVGDFVVARRSGGSYPGTKGSR